MPVIVSYGNGNQRFYTSSQQFSLVKCLLLDSRNGTQCWCNNLSRLCLLEELNIGVLSKRSDAKFVEVGSRLGCGLDNYLLNCSKEGTVTKQPNKYPYIIVCLQFVIQPAGNMRKAVKVKDMLLPNADVCSILIYKIINS